MNEIKEILQKNGFSFSKKFGQNFLSDENLLKSICCDGEVNETDEVLEIGPGAGALSRELCKKAKKVVCFEIDNSLKTVLDEVLKPFSNVEVVFADALKTPNEQICSHFEGDFKIVANIPYYITTPLIFKFMPLKNVKSLTLMVQKEVAERIQATNTAGDYGALSVFCQHLCKCCIKRTVSKNMFYPIPKVDSAIIHLEKRQIDFSAEYENKFNEIVRTSFANKRKTLQNNLSSYKPKDEVAKILTSLNLNPKARAEELSLDDFEKLVHYFL